MELAAREPACFFIRSAALALLCKSCIPKRLDPISGGNVEIIVKEVILERAEGSVLFSIGQDHNSEALVRNQLHSRDKSSNPAAVGGQLGVGPGVVVA